MCTEDRLREVIDRMGGQLLAGKHAEGSGECCILEAHSVCIGIPWSDNPQDNGTWDFRPLNDMPIPAWLRTQWMPRVMAAYEGCRSWPAERQITVANELGLKIGRYVLSDAAWSHQASETAREAAEAASSAGKAAGKADDTENAFVCACELWIAAMVRGSSVE